MGKRKTRTLRQTQHCLCSFASSIPEIIQVMENWTFKSFPLTFLPSVSWFFLCFTGHKCIGYCHPWQPDCSKLSVKITQGIQNKTFLEAPSIFSSSSPPLQYFLYSSVPPQLLTHEYFKQATKSPQIFPHTNIGERLWSSQQYGISFIPRQITSQSKRTVTF